MITVLPTLRLIITLLTFIFKKGNLDFKHRMERKEKPRSNSVAL